MTVEELMKSLSRCDPKARVWVWNEHVKTYASVRTTVGLPTIAGADVELVTTLCES